MANERKPIFILSGVVIVGMILLPLTAVMVDILIALNLLFPILIFIIALKIKKAADLYFLPTVLLLITIFGLTASISSTRLILTNGKDFNDWLIKPIASLVAGFGDITNIIISFVFLIVFVAALCIILVKSLFRVSEIAARFDLDSLPIKLLAFDAEFASGAITNVYRRRFLLYSSPYSAVHCSRICCNAHDNGGYRC